MVMKIMVREMIMSRVHELCANLHEHEMAELIIMIKYAGCTVFLSLVALIHN